jgi:predicted permease
MLGGMHDGLIHDIRHAARGLRRSPGFAVTAIGTLALGIGLNAAVATILNALVIRPLPVPDPDRLVGVSSRGPRGELRVTLPGVVEGLSNSGPLQSVCGYNGGVVLGIEADGLVTQGFGAFVSGRCFEVLGVAAQLGRTIEDEDAPLGRRGRPVAVISHGLWIRQFGGDPAVVGQTLRAEGAPLTIIGVMPAGFRGLHVDLGIDVFAPFGTILPGRQDRPPGASEILGRLAPGTGFDQAAVELRARWPALVESSVPSSVPPRERDDFLAARAEVVAIGRGVSNLRTTYGRPMMLVGLLTLVLLLMACVNLGSVVLTRLAARGSEIAIRSTLGAGRWRIGRIVAIEVLILAGLATVVAVPVSLAIVAMLVSYLPASTVTSNPLSFAPDLRVFVATAAIGVATGLASGAIPAWLGMRSLFGWQVGATRVTTNAGGRGLRLGLALQVALAVVLVTTGGLLVRSLYLLQRNAIGVRTDGVLVVRVQPVPGAYPSLDNAAHYPALLEAIAAVPGVRSVGMSRLFPRLLVRPVGVPVAFVGDTSGHVMGTQESASPRLFETLGIPLLAGRLPSWTDGPGTPPVVVVNAALASSLGPALEVVGRRVRLGSDPGLQDVEVVGVVGNATLGSPRFADLPIFYLPTLQAGRFANYPSVLVAADGDATAVATRVRALVAATGREFVQDIAPLDRALERAPSAERMSAAVAGLIAALAAALASLGVYGALAITVARRTREIGVRMALGATAESVRRLVLRDGLVVVVCGVVLGLPLALAAARVMRILLFQVTPHDPAVFAATAGTLVGLGLLASWLPARRASTVDPAVTMRTE